MSVKREPVIRRPAHPAAGLPERPTSFPTAADPQPAAAAVPQPAPQPRSGEERLTEQHNVRLRPSTKARLLRGVDKLRYETGDRSISIASITDEAINEYLEARNC